MEGKAVAAAGQAQAGGHGTQVTSFTQLGTDTLVRRLLGQLIVRMRDGPGIGGDGASNYAGLLELTLDAQDRIGARYTDGSQLKQQYSDTLNLIHEILVAMRDRGEPFGKVEVLALLLNVDTYSDNIFA